MKKDKNPSNNESLLVYLEKLIDRFYLQIITTLAIITSQNRDNSDFTNRVRSTLIKLEFKEI